MDLLRLPANQNRAEALKLAIAAKQPVEKMAERLEAGPKTPQDIVEIGANTQVQPENEKAAKKLRLGRKIRKGFLGLTSAGAAVYNGILGIPEGIAIGLGASKGDSKEKLRARAGAVNLVTKTAAAAVIAGALGGGPMIIGAAAVAGLIGSAVSNHISAFTGKLDENIDTISKAARGKNHETNEKLNLGQTLKGLPKAAASGFKSAAKNSLTNGRILTAGVLDGVEFSYKNRRGLVSNTGKVEGQKESTLRSALKLAAGGIFGLVGSMINAPGGFVVGALRSLETEDGQTAPKEMTNTLMFLATNIAKLMPGSLAGSVGGSAGFSVGAATGSITSIIDGKDGFHKGIVRQVDLSLDQAHDGEEAKDNLRAYYRAGKGAVVGGVTGVHEGWRVGFESGAKIMDSVLDLGKSSVDVANQKDQAEEAKAGE